MFKLLFVALVFVSVNCCLIAQSPGSPKPVQQLGFGGTAKDNPTKDLHYTGQSPQTGTEAIPFHVETHRGPATEAEAAKEQEQGYREARAKVWERMIAFLTLFIAAVQSFIFWRQLLIFRKQTEISEKQMALTQNLERPWLTETLMFSSDFPLMSQENKTVAGVRLKNIGRSVAILSRVSLELETRESVSPLPDLPIYLRNVVTGASGVSIPATEERLFLIDRQQYLTDGEINQLVHGILNLYCYGRIEYKDTFGKLHVKQFCQQYHMRREGEPDFVEGFRVAGPDSYNQSS